MEPGNRAKHVQLQWNLVNFQFLFVFMVFETCLVRTSPPVTPRPLSPNFCDVLFRAGAPPTTAASRELVLSRCMGESILSEKES